MSRDLLMEVVVPTLRDKCGLCSACINICIGSHCNDDIYDVRKPCTLCFGLLSLSSQVKNNNNILEKNLISIVEEKFRPYGNGGSHEKRQLNMPPNYISKDSPTIVLPNIILIIAHCINCTIEQILEQQNEKSIYFQQLRIFILKVFA